MKVLLIAHGLPPQSVGGTEIHASAFARTLHDAFGDDVLILARECDDRRPESAVRRDDPDGVAIAWVNQTFRDSRSFAATYRNADIADVAGSLADEFQPDVAHVHHLTGLGTDVVDALASRGIPTYLTLHDYWLLCHRGQLLDPDGRLCAGPEPDGCAACVGLAGAVGPAGHRAAGWTRALERRLPESVGTPLRRSAEWVAGRVADESRARLEARNRLEHMRRTLARFAGFIAPSEHVQRRFIAAGVPPSRITTIPLGIDPAPFRDRARSGSATARFGFLGSLIPSKAPHLAIAAFGRLPAGAATLDVFGGHVSYHGDDGYRRLLEALPPIEGLRFRGALPHDEVPAALAEIDVLVVPSVWPETSGLVVKEAFLAGAVVVASRIGGLAEAVRDGVDGILVEPGDVEALAAELARLVREPAELRRLRSGIRKPPTITDHVEAVRALYPMARPAPIRTTAVVLNYGTPGDTVIAVRSLIASRRPCHRIVVVDNDAAAGSCREALRPLADAVDYLPTERNLGFSGGMNVGVRRALAEGADRVLVVNSDVFVPPDCLERLGAALDARPDAGIAGPTVRVRSTPDVVSSMGMRYHERTGRMRHRAAGERRGSPVVAGVEAVDAVSGCLMLIRRQVIDAVGPFDEDFFFGFEDLELCLRARRAGFVTVLAAGASVLHEGGLSMGEASPRRLYFAARNHLLAARRAAPETGLVRAGLRSALIVGFNLAHGLRARGASAPVRLTAVVRGALDYARGRLGEGS